MIPTCTEWGSISCCSSFRREVLRYVDEATSLSVFKWYVCSDSEQFIGWLQVWSERQTGLETFACLHTLFEPCYECYFLNNAMQWAFGVMFLHSLHRLNILFWIIWMTLTFQWCDWLVNQSKTHPSDSFILSSKTMSSRRLVLPIIQTLYSWFPVVWRVAYNGLVTLQIITQYDGGAPSWFHCDAVNFVSLMHFYHSRWNLPQA